MITTTEQFKILIAGRKQLLERVRKMVITSDEIHLQFTSSPDFVMGRAVFQEPHVVLIDATFGRPVLENAFTKLRAQFKNVFICIVAVSPDHLDAGEFIKLGASGYYTFPDDYRKLSEEITNLLDEWQIEKSQKRFLQLQQRTYDFGQILGKSPPLLEVLRRARKVIENTSMTVLITGETGSGKELMARAIHYNSANCGSPFVDIGCSALPETLLESELFGFEKGAFTDARERKLGLFELAGDGSIFLDEIGDMSLAMQSKLLKVIESRTMRRLGGVQDIPVRARIIAATGAELESKMKSGQFRKDLFHRLRILPLEIPPLRERKEDIPFLAQSFLDLFVKSYGKTIGGITTKALDLLMRCDWEGNVRELKHSIERAVLLREEGQLDENDFDFLSKSDSPPGESDVPRNGENAADADKHTFVLELPIEESSMEDIQRKVALKILEHVHGNKSKAAYILRISRPRLNRILTNHHD